MQELKYFDAAFVINLPFKGDRLSRFKAICPDILGDVLVWEAVHGDTVRPPAFWQSGNGAWGCYRSHMQVLEYAIAKKLKSYIVFEDDAIFSNTFTEDLNSFMAEVPEDWQQLYLGGQLIHEIRHPPKRMTDWVFMPYNVNRTHCFAVHERGYYAMYSHLNSLPFQPKEHIDHHLGRLHESGKFHVYCPKKWLVGQGEGWSNVSGKYNSDLYWPDPESCAMDHPLLQDPRCVFLESPLEVAKELQLLGWHQGFWKDENGLDRGVCEAIGHLYPEIKLKQWYDWARREVVRDGMRVPCLYHPALTWDKVQVLPFAHWIRIKTESAVDAVQQLSEIYK